MAAGSILNLAGFGLQAYGAFGAGMAQAEAGFFNAELARIDANLTRQRGAEEARLIRLQGEKQAGAMRASVGKSGIEMTGSAMELITESIVNSTMDAFLAEYNAEITARGLERTARLNEKQAKSAGRAAIINTAVPITFGAAQLIG